MSSSNWCFLTCIQVSQEAGQVVWYSHLSEFSTADCDPHSQRVWHSQSSRNRCFSGTLLLFPWSSGCCQFDLWFSARSKTSLNIWNFMVHALLKPGLENFEHYFPSLWDECNCAIVWGFFGIAFLWDWNENWPFNPVATAEFSKFAGTLNAVLSQHHLLGFEIAQLEFHHLH